MNIQPEALLYNFNDPERLRQIRRYLNRQKVKTRIVTAPEFLHPLGYLFEIPGFHPSSQFNLGSNFSDEMIVLKDFSSAQMDDFLAFFRENQIAGYELEYPDGRAVCVFYNPWEKEAFQKLPEGNWKLLCDGKRCAEDGAEMKESMMLPAKSMVLLAWE